MISRAEADGLTPCPAAASGGSCRELPDVSAQADEYTGAITVYAKEFGGWTTFGGTSSSTPLWAAMTALVNASDGCPAGGLGFVSPEITSPARTAEPVVVTILGGVGTLYGPLVGAIVYTGMKDVLSKVLGNWELVIGFVLVFIMLAGEKGIWGTLEPLFKKAALRIAGKMGDGR